MILQQIIERLYDIPPDQLAHGNALGAFNQLKEHLNNGDVRAAEFVGGTWRVNPWVKKGILLGFRLGALVEWGKNGLFRYFDKDTMSVKEMAVDDNVRIVPGGTAIRDGAFVGKGVIIMPPSYINVGAYIDEGTMIDSHALVGSCAQIGKRVHLSAGSQIGGVLEPVGDMPVIIEDEAMVGGNCGVFEGMIVRRRAVLAAGVILTGSTPVYDVVKKKIYRKTPEAPLIIPENAVVVPGARALEEAWATAQHVALYTPVIVKYRDETTDAATALETSLR